MPWKDISIDQVYTANDVPFAKQIIQTFSIQIILCDIEMPGESGIDFLHWLKDNQYSHIITLLLTCHDDFSYAKEGIQLGVMDYILKPIAFDELSEILKKAVMEYQSRHTNQLRIHAGQLWEKHKDSIVKSFWRDFFANTTDQSGTALNDLGFTKTSEYLLIIFRQKDNFRTLTPQDVLIFLEQQMAPVFSYIHMEFTLFSPQESWYYIIAWKNEPDHCKETLQYLYARFQSMVMSLHINQINLCGCFDRFVAQESLHEQSRTFVRFLDQQETQIGMFIADTHWDFPESDQMASAHLFEDIADYVRRHMAVEMTRQDIADHVHLNADYLTRIFKRKMGITLTEYIRLERLNYARYLLRNSEMSISEIALATGFNTPSHFSSSFRKQFECAPLDYRNIPYCSTINTN